LFPPLSTRVLSPVVDAIARSLRTSISIRGTGGELVLRACPDEGALDVGSVEGDLEGGAERVVLPLVVEGVRIGSIVAGPIWRRRPTPPAMRAFLRGVGSPRLSTERLCGRARVVTGRARPHFEASLASLAQVLSQLCEERARQQRAVTTLSTLNRIGQAVTSQLSLEEVLEDVLDGAFALLDADEGSIMLLDEARATLRIVAARGLSPEIVASTVVPVGAGVSGQVAAEGRPRLLMGGEREARSPVEALKPAMSVPLVARGVVIGVLNIKGQADFSEDDLALLCVLASQAAAAIANAQLYQSARKRASEMSALFSIGTAINSELERNQVLQRVLDQAIDLLDSRKGSIMLLNSDTRELSVEVAYGLSEEIRASVRLRLGEGIAGKVAEEGRARRLRKGVVDSDSRSGRERHSALCVPLVVRDHVIGVLNVSDRRDGSDFTDEHLELCMMLANQAGTAIENARLHDDLHELFVSSITALANAIDARDPYTRGHSERVAVYSVRIAERVGLSGRDLDFLRYAALLHDVGKINIRDEILNKPGRLTDDEFSIMKRHPEYGAAIMMPVKAFQKIIPFMFYHHERYCAGGGYPVGLSGDAIPIEARIIAVADAYDAMTSHRPYRRALTIDQAVGELIKNSGSQFDPKLVDVFLQILEEDPVFARSGIEASMRAEKEGWIRASTGGAFSPRGGPPVSPRPRIPSTG
jgi:putative nucleotidyltransferase with HDIG domain